MHSFIDESRRRGVYLLASVEVAASDVSSLRRRLRSCLLAGQRRLHFVDERDRRRKQLLNEFGRWPLQSRVLVVRLGTRNESEGRRLALESILATLDSRVERLVIESRHGRDNADRRVIAS